MSLRDRCVTKWSPTPDDPLNGCADRTRRLYALIVAEPGINQRIAFKSVGFGEGAAGVTTLVSRGLVEVRQDDRCMNYLWPVSR